MDNLNLVDWDERYSVGVKVIDDQHKQLVVMANELYAGCLHGDEAAKEYFAKTIHQAVDYVKVHFATEELLMHKISYPRHHIHKKEHEDFVQKILTEVGAFSRGEKFVPNHFARYLRDWVLEHIAISDRLYGDFLASRLKQVREAKAARQAPAGDPGATAL